MRPLLIYLGSWLVLSFAIWTPPLVGQKILRPNITWCWARLVTCIVMIIYGLIAIPSNKPPHTVVVFILFIVIPIFFLGSSISRVARYCARPSSGRQDSQEEAP